MILVVDLCHEKDSLSSHEFVKPIARIAGKCTIKHYTEIKKKDLENCGKIILCGTALRDNGYMENLESFGWVKETGKPVLGICAGMQVICRIFGAKLVRNKEIGMTKIKLIRENALFSSDLSVYELHGYALENLENFEILAKSGRYVQAVKHREKEIYGIMFHPEVRQEKIVENFVGL